MKTVNNEKIYYMPLWGENYRFIYDYTNDKFYLTKKTVNIDKVLSLSAIGRIALILLEGTIATAIVAVTTVIAPFFGWMYDIKYPIILCIFFAVIFGVIYKNKVYPKRIEKYDAEKIEVTLESVKKTYIFRLISFIPLIFFGIFLFTFPLLIPVNEELLIAQVLVAIMYVFVVPVIIVEADIRGYALLIKRIMKK